VAGHSKWANIQHRKGRQDEKRGKIWTRIIREITVAARAGGGDLSANPRLRLAVDKAKAANMPADRVKYNIDKATGNAEGMSWLRELATMLAPGQPIYVLLYAAAIIFFAFFYTAIVFNPRETADNLKKQGALVPGFRPGEQTARYVDTVLTRLTAAGAVYISLVCLLPEFLILEFRVPFYFGGTSLLIIVVVIMDFIAQVQTHLQSHQYAGLLRKANLKGYGRR